jgi:DNA-binding IclR family transcriptional regulator
VEKNGYACDLEEHELHIRCIAAPIWDHTGGLHASLSITAPMVRMPVSRLRQLAPLIQQAGLRISRELGYQPSKPAYGNSLSRSTIGEGAPLAKPAV